MAQFTPESVVQFNRNSQIRGVLIPVVISFILALDKLINISSNRFVTKMGPGLYLLLFFLAVVLISCFVFMKKDSATNQQ